MAQENKPLVAVIMGSKSDWDVMKSAADTLAELGRTPAALTDYIADAESRGCEVFIAAAGGAAHLAGVVAAQTLRPVLGVPMTSALQGLDSLLSMVQMPAGIPVGTLAIGKPGAVNAALFAVAILATLRPAFREKLQEYRDTRARKILEEKLP
jgi:5-(carboxyamino)imidazole ribonucleotide mutase